MNHNSPAPGQPAGKNRPLFDQATAILSAVSDWAALAAQAGFREPELAKMLGVSLRRLERHFQASTGRCPREWLGELRLRTAAVRLAAGATVDDVAAELGYHDRSHFRRRFREFFREAPTEFVASWKRREAEWIARDGGAAGSAPPAAELSEAVRALAAPLGGGDPPSGCAAKSVRVVLLDGAPETRRALQEAFALLAPRWRLEACAASSGSAERLAQAPPAAVLLGGGARANPRLAAIETLAARLPGVPILVVAPEAESGVVLSTLAAGAADYLPLESGPREIVQAVGEVLDGTGRLRLQTQAALLQLLRRAFIRGRLAGLTPQEAGVRLLLTGCSEKEAAQQLGLSVHTVNALARRVSHKLKEPARQ
jgi:DNA-binding NarL/FixJ family response regulator/AraC-like DNA-binding protein